MKPGTTAVVHAASSEWIAMREVSAGFASYGILHPRKAPRITVELIASFSNLADVRGIETSLHGLSMKDLLSEDWHKVNSNGFESLSQAVGRALWLSGFEGLITPSAQSEKGFNLLWFPAALHETSAISISGSEELEKCLLNNMY